MEGEQQREGNRRRESRPRGGRNAGPRSERSQNENRPRQDENQRDRQPRRPRLPNIQLRRDPKDIKLNEEQQKQVFELDQKIGNFGNIEIPQLEEREEKMKEFEFETQKLQSQLQTYREKVDEIQKKIEEFDKKHDPLKKEHDEIRAQIKKIDEVLFPTIDKLKSLREQKISANSKLNEIRQKTPGRSIEDIDYQIDQLQYQIETTTLTNTQLKSKLTQIEQLKKSRGQFGDVAQIQNSISHIRETETELLQTKKKLQEEKDALWKQIHTFSGDNKAFKEQRDELWASKKETFGKIDELKKQINAKYAERKSFNNEFFEKLGAQRQKRNEYAVLVNQRLQIFQEAERHMDLIEKGQNKVGEIKERINPNDQKINAASSLIGFLQSKLAYHEDFQQPVKKVEKEVVETDATRLINSIRKPTKKERKNQRRGEKPKDEKPKAKKITFTLDAIQQFALVGVTQPVTHEEIPKVIEELKSKVSEWKSAFIKVVLNFDVQADGSIKSHINLE
jgi:chromosome segregation ATPase